MYLRLKSGMSVQSTDVTKHLKDRFKIILEDIKVYNMLVE